MSTPIKSNELNGWDGNSRKGQAAYDRHFQFEMAISEAQDIIANEFDYSEEEVDAAKKLIEKYR
ncbi:MAG TPA: hypothetical protein VIM77_10325 [Mucilaginibacter sp.]